MKFLMPYTQCHSTIGVSDVGEFINRIHGIGGTVSFLDTKTISIENFRYDGQGVGKY